MEQNEIGLQYFVKLLNSKPLNTEEHTAAKWDIRADAWEKAYDEQKSTVRKGDDRIQGTVDYLKSRSALAPDYEVADVGCGPGRFAAAFARDTRHVTGIDISEKMINAASSYVKRENTNNVSFLLRDFQTVDVERENLAGKFDLVFSSLTPAVHGMAGLEKTMLMSRKYCCNITHIYSENVLEHRMMREIFERGRTDPWEGNWRYFYAMFNALFLMGYHPEATYQKRRQEKYAYFDAERTNLFIEKMLPYTERTKDNEKKIREWLLINEDKEGKFTEESTVMYGRLLWDVEDCRMGLRRL